MFKTILIYALITTLITFIVLFSIYVPMIAHGIVTEGNGNWNH